jgi:hypothetical protein
VTYRVKLIRFHGDVQIAGSMKQTVDLEREDGRHYEAILDADLRALCITKKETGQTIVVPLERVSFVDVEREAPKLQAVPKK